MVHKVLISTPLPNNGKNHAIFMKIRVNIQINPQNSGKTVEFLLEIV